MAKIKVSKEPVKESPEIEMRHFLTNPDTVKIGLDAANHIQLKLKNWFTIDQLINKTGYKEILIAVDILNLLCLLELCYREEKIEGVIKYKITIGKESRLELLWEERDEAVAQVEYIDRMIAKYN